MADSSFVLFALGPVQGFIKAARTVRDLWSGSYLLSYLTFQAMDAVVRYPGSSAGAIVFPNYAELPLANWTPGTRASPDVLEPCIPNRFLAEVPGTVDAAAVAAAAEDACRKAWTKIATSVYDKLSKGAPDLDPYGLWGPQIEQFFEVYTAVLPQAACDTERIKTLLGAASGNEWSDGHQIAQKALAAKKGVRHLPQYAPVINGEVPQKDTLLGTLEHLGPGNRQAAGKFWERAAEPDEDGGWTDRGSRVSDGERLCAISLVKRFAWAHYFSHRFDLNAQELRFNDTATVAAAKWLQAGEALDPLKVRRAERDWNGTWLHRDKPDAPVNAKGERIKGERAVPLDVWNAIAAKKKAQGKPPSYYAVFVFDGDNMGDRFNAAPDSDVYRDISNALTRFALDRKQGIQPIVEKNYRGELIYAGGDDAICVLPTETALACASAIDAAFKANWQLAFPNQKLATISGGLVVAHYKEDLRFVMEQAHAAEKRSKGAGRDALTVTVCRRSGEHSSAVVPWGFADTVGEWVSGFLGGASDRWGYKLRGDLPVFENDPAMFQLELGRQLGRAEDATRRHFKGGAVKSDFDTYYDLILHDERQKKRKEKATDKDAITDFITLVQTASFLARGRDA